MKPVFKSRKLPENINRIISQFPAEVQEFFLEMISAERSKQTIANYAYDFALFFDYLNSINKTIDQVDPMIIKRFFRQIENGYERTVHILRKKKDPKTGKIKEEWITRTHYRENSQSGKQRKRASLRSLFRFLVKTARAEPKSNGRIRRCFIEKPFAPESSRLSDQRRGPRLLHAVKTYHQKKNTKSPEWMERRDLAILLLFLNTGMRVSELIQLNLNSIQSDGEVMRVIILGKGGKERMLKLNETAKQALRNYLSVRPENKADREHQQALFLNKNYQRISRKGISDIISKYVREANLPPKAASISPS